MEEAIATLATNHTRLDEALVGGDVDAVLSLIEERGELLAGLKEAWQAANAEMRTRHQAALLSLQHQERDLLQRCLQQRIALQSQLAASAHRQGAGAMPAVSNLLDRQA